MKAGASKRIEPCLRKGQKHMRGRGAPKPKEMGYSKQLSPSLARQVGFASIRGAISGFPIIGTIVLRGLDGGPPIYGNYKIGQRGVL